MTKKLSYLAGPFTSDDIDIREHRFRCLNLVASVLINSGKLIFSPISHSYPIAKEGSLPKTWEFWLEFDTAYLEVCKEMYVLTIEGWRESVGVTAEIQIAKKLGIPIIYIDIDCKEVEV